MLYWSDLKLPDTARVAVRKISMQLHQNEKKKKKKKEKKKRFFCFFLAIITIPTVYSVCYVCNMQISKYLLMLYK